MARSTRTPARGAVKASDAAPKDESLLRLVAQLLAEHDLSEFEIERGGLRIRAARSLAAVAAPIAPTILATPFPAGLSLIHI